MTRGYWDKVMKNRIARRRVLQGGAGLGLSAAALVALGCGDDDDDDGGSGSPGGGGNDKDAKAGGSVKFGMLSDLTSLEPHVFITDHTDTIWQIWERLTEYDSDLNPTGRLAESWEVNDDSTEFVFKLRPGVKWHAGGDFVAEDVKYNFLRVRDASTGFALLKTQSEWYDTIEVFARRPYWPRHGASPRSGLSSASQVPQCTSPASRVCTQPRKPLKTCSRE